ncbi:MAG: glycoside hydrolase family 127 protein, partial [Bacteroidaceae bacterium]|nr:glycoside hydrolase family 127 protein [Bacteroidaceae bacterium]
MKNKWVVWVGIAFSFASVPLFSQNESLSLKKVNQVDFSHISIKDNFWSPRLEKHLSATLPVCIDQIENKTGRIQNFERAAKGRGEHSGIFFDDSDVYKAMEGMAYALANARDAKLEAKLDEWIDKIAACQQPDGYINTFYTLTGLQNRWTDMDKHEMYCAGHMIEAGVAYYQATGKRKLMDVGIRMAEHCMSLFDVGKGHWVPGHEEIELALVKLSLATGEKRFLNFAHHLLEQRGHGYGSTGKPLMGRPAGGAYVHGQWNPSYYQDEMPVRNLSVINGHAVRAMYLFTGMADVAALKHDTAYVSALHRLWDNVVGAKMYVTGGIGSSKQNEGFTADFDLPNKEAYCETCASVGMVFWNQRMNQLTGDAKYADVMERSLYNGALAGISLQGDKFFYVNPLESDGKHHRQEWYGCACCPSQISRFLPSIGNYIYGTSPDALYINLYLGNEADISLNGNGIKVSQTTEYPWKGKVEILVEAGQPISQKLKMRIPGWCRQYTIKVDGKKV